MKTTQHIHGGDLDGVARKYQLDRNTLLDFSGNINPLGISPLAKEALRDNLELISTYPDRNYVSLKQVLSEYCHTKPDSILVGNGTTELISLTIHTQKARKALLLGPTYSEYERELRLVQGELDYFYLKEEDDFCLNINALLDTLKQENYDLLVICNPNNPTGTALSTSILEQTIHFCQQHNIFVMVDETYIEFCEDPWAFSSIPLTHQFSNLLVLRGISKFFSAPGLRFGYAICSNKDLKDKLSVLQNPWSVTILSSLAAEKMIQDTAYIQNTHQLFCKERARIVHELLKINQLKVFIPTANFVLLKLHHTHISSQMIQERLLQKNMLIRDASTFPSLSNQFIRFCFLRPEDNTALIQELTTLLR
jgi:threonine-phosphate decarboxylase